MRRVLQILIFLSCFLQADPIVASTNIDTPNFSNQQADQKVENEEKAAVFHYARNGIYENAIKKTQAHYSTKKQSLSFIKDVFQNFGVLYLEKSLSKSWVASIHFSQKEQLSLLENRACVRGEVFVKGAGSLAESLTGTLKTSYNKLVANGLSALEHGSVIKLFNSENKLIAEITNNQLVFKYSGYGGDITMVEGKTTTVFGRFNDPIHSGGTKEFIQNPNKVYETGANPS